MTFYSIFIHNSSCLPCLGHILLYKYVPSQIFGSSPLVEGINIWGLGLRLSFRVPRSSILIKSGAYPALEGGWAQQSKPTGKFAPQLFKSWWQKRSPIHSESSSQSPSPNAHGHSPLQHAQSSLEGFPQPDGQSR